MERNTLLWVQTRDQSIARHIFVLVDIPLDDPFESWLAMVGTGSGVENLGCMRTLAQELQVATEKKNEKKVVP